MDMGENGSGGAGYGSGSDVAQISADLLGLNGPQAFAQAAITVGMPIAGGYLAALDFATANPLEAAIAGMAYVAAGDRLAGLLNATINQIAADYSSQVNVMTAINMDGQMFAMEDPVTGMGYWS